MSVCKAEIEEVTVETGVGPRAGETGEGIVGRRRGVVEERRGRDEMKRWRGGAKGRGNRGRHCGKEEGCGRGGEGGEMR